MNNPPLFGPYGRTVLAYAERLSRYGANAAWFHMFDAEAFEICAQHGLAPCVEFKTFRADFTQHPHLIPTGVDGKPIRYGRLVQGVCLSQTEFLAEIEEALWAGIRAYQPAGIWLDYLTYAGWFEVPDPDLQESCFCPSCVAEFCEATGIDAAKPNQILSQHSEAWTRHKCERIAQFGHRYAEIIRSALPSCIIGAYMCPWTPQEFDDALTRIFAQDYTLLAPSIDIFTPLIYAQKSGRDADWGRQWLEASPTFIPADRQTQLILDALDFPVSLQAAAQAESPSWGIQLFGGADIFAHEERAAIFQQAVEQIQHTLTQA
ncbi:MAG: hypothetical protein KF893_08690 [Caldilineaceae bacterium]|nr:hypothetical protein [Caldilineaceae bacterium]